MRDILPSSTADRWAGLTAQVDAPARSGLRIEVAGGRRLLLRQANRVVLLGRQRAMYGGVDYARTGAYRSPLPPIRADHARRIRVASVDDGAWAARWTHQFADWLQAATEGPLYAGRWILAWGMPRWSVPRRWQRLPTMDWDQGHITWFGYGVPDDDVRDVLPLRPLSAASVGRVRSYRRQVREGMAPPVLLWWVSGLDALVVLDGHDRIVAALAEQTLPEIVLLAPAADPSQLAAMRHHAARAYQGRLGHLQAATDQEDQRRRQRIANVTADFAVDIADIARREGRARAWLLPGGQPEWERQAHRLAPGWSPEPT